MATAILGESRGSADQHRPRELDRVLVHYVDGKRQVTCFCHMVADRSIVPHFKSKHPHRWRRWVRLFIELRAEGFPLKKIMRLFRAGSGHLLFSWTVVERSIRAEVESGRVRYLPPPTREVVAWEPVNFAQPRTSVWSFPTRGDWAVHSGDYRGNWPPDLVRALILRYSRRGQVVVDAFAGGGTSLIEAWLLGRRSLGLDISELALATTRSKLSEMAALAVDDPRIQLDESRRPIVLNADALDIDHVLPMALGRRRRIRLLCVHPPYLDALRYTVDDARDLSSHSDPEAFLDRIRLFASLVRNLMTPSGTCAVLIGDVRRGGELIPLGLRTLDAFLSAGFRLKETVIKTQHKDRSSEFYLTQPSDRMLIAHEYLLIFQNRR